QDLPRSHVCAKPRTKGRVTMRRRMNFVQPVRTFYVRVGIGGGKRSERTYYVKVLQRQTGQNAAQPGDEVFRQRLPVVSRNLVRNQYRVQPWAEMQPCTDVARHRIVV